MAPDSIHSLPPVHVGEPVRAHRHRPRRTCTSRAATCRATRSRTRAARYEEAIARAGGIDFQILGIGKTGHIGFNEPGSGAESRTRLVTLDPSRGATPPPTSSARRTCRARRSRWASRRSSRRARSRSSPPASTRRAIVRRAVEGEIDVEVAATFLQRHPNTTFYVDRAAAAELTRDRDALAARRGRVDARARRCAPWSGCRSRRSKAILKLTQRDYAEHRLSSLVARYGSPGAVNGEVFNTLGAKIRGKIEAAARPADHLLLARTRTTTSSRWAASCASCVENENEITSPT